MDTTKRVVPAPGYLLERIDQEVVVYHPTRTTSLYLNETGALIWEMCDGARTTADIIGILTELYPESRQEIGAQVEAMIMRLEENKIVELQA